MVNRHNLIKGATTGLLPTSVGTRRLFAQLIGSRYKFVMGSSGLGPETVIDGPARRGWAWIWIRTA